jgi:hypothetical protein
MVTTATIPGQQDPGVGIPNTGTYHIVRLQIQVDGTGQPDVSFFSDNPKLQFRVLHLASKYTKRWLTMAYPANFDDVTLGMLDLNEDGTGREVAVSWYVSWVQSDKNARWKDITKIYIPKLGEPEVFDRGLVFADPVPESQVDPSKAPSPFE